MQCAELIALSQKDQRIERQVRRIREQVLERHGFRPNDSIPTDAADSALEEVARLAVTNAHWGIVSDIPVAGRIIVLWRRALRIALRWYINPIVEQQNAFNQAVLRALYELKYENDAPPEPKLTNNAQQDAGTERR
jgi:hypothetical protein